MDKKLLVRIQRMANSSDWEIKEMAASKIKEINDKYFIDHLPVWKQWICHKNPNIRRALEVGLLRIPKAHAKEAFSLLLPLLNDDNRYVRKNCGPFALSAVSYKIPSFAFKEFHILIKDKNQNMRWNIAMCMGAMFGIKYPDKALYILKKVCRDKRHFVWRAAVSSLIKIIRKYPHFEKDVFGWKNCDNCLNTI
ncbi:HEAT repeat domain-containing protein, partial [Patescibacteria group bacterium]|nr:HEAT repeat domain-containing protein [Patescibacteria group bacterium]